MSYYQPHFLLIAASIAVWIVLAAIAVFVLYWVIRLAVSHALHDHHRRTKPPIPPAPAPPTAPPAPQPGPAPDRPDAH